MAFDFDEYINRVCIGEGTTQGVFGVDAIFKPASGGTVNLTVQFIEDYAEVEFSNATEEVVSDTSLVCFLRTDDSGVEPLQGDLIEINSTDYKIIDVQKFVPGSRKLVLHRN